MSHVPSVCIRPSIVAGRRNRSRTDSWTAEFIPQHPKRPVTFNPHMTAMDGGNAGAITCTRPGCRRRIHAVRYIPRFAPAVADVLAEALRHKVLTFLCVEGCLDPDLAAWMLQWRQSGFSAIAPALLYLLHPCSRPFKTRSASKPVIQPVDRMLRLLFVGCLAVLKRRPVVGACGHIDRLQILECCRVFL